MLRHLYTLNWSNVVCWITGAAWAWIHPTVPWIVLCTAAVVIDCISAIRLNRRVRNKYGEKACDGKIKSVHMFKMMDDLFVVYATILVAHGMNTYIFPGISMPLANLVAGIFTAIELFSVCENESSCNGSLWALAFQKYIADKTKRHLNIDLEELKEEVKEK